MTVLLTPTTRAKASKVGGRTYRKQILKRGSLNYRQPDGTTRRLTFDDAMFADLSKAFHERAYDSAKVFAAGADNGHTVDVDRIRGTVVDLVPSEDGSGLDAVVTLSEDGARLVDEHPDLGVSARIREGLERGDGRSWPRALHHVLLTTDPRVTGLSPWKSVDLSTTTDDGPVVDLSDSELTEPQGVSMPDLSDADIERIVAGLAGRLGGLQQGTEGAESATETSEEAPAPIDWSDFFDDGVSESDVADFFAQMDEEDGGGDGEEGYADADLVGAGVGGEGAQTDLSNPSSDYIDLAAQNAALTEQMAHMHEQMATQHWEAERNTLLHQGVPPAMLDLAAPVLSASAAGHSIDLSNGSETVDVAGVVRGLLRHHIGFVDLSAEQGHAVGAPLDVDDTAALHAAYEREHGITRTERN